MRTGTDGGAVARAIIDANLYMTIGSVDADGLPWTSPVYFTAHNYRELYWVSHPDATHSENIATRADVSVVVFDSGVAPSTGQAVYMRARASELTGTADFESGLERFNFSRYDEPTRHGLTVFEPDAVLPPGRLRLYRAVVSQHFILEEDVDRRMPVEPSHS